MAKIFLAHAQEDKDTVIRLYEKLKREGYQPWLDKMDLLAGQNWRVEIPKAIKQSHIFIACFSKLSVGKRGYIQKEFKMALNEYANRPSDVAYIIPLRLDVCSIPDIRNEEYGIRIRDIQWVDLFEPDGFEKLLLSLQWATPTGIEGSVDSSHQTAGESLPSDQSDQIVSRKGTSEYTSHYEEDRESSYASGFSARSILKAEEQACVALEFVHKSSPALVIRNESSVVARDIKWAVALWNLDLRSSNEPLPIPIGTFDSIKPYTVGGPQGLFTNQRVSSIVKPGHRLIGTASVDCPYCTEGRSYLVSLVYGEGGWFTELVGKGGRLFVPKVLTNQAIENDFREIAESIPTSQRKSIGD